MMDLFRKHKKAVYWAIIILVGVPFVFITTDYVPFMNQAHNALLPDELGPVATVAGQPIEGDELRQALDQRNQPAPGQDRVDYAALAAAGKVDEALDDLVKTRLVQNEVAAVNLNYDRKYLEETLKKDRSFQTDGQFDPELWNSWIRDERATNADWNAIYNNVQQGVNGLIVRERIASSARVREEELRQEFDRNNTAVTLKYAAIEPAIVPTEEQIQAHYEANKAAYDIPEKRRAEFFAVSTAPARPAILDEFLAQARSGKDFETIAKEAPEGLDVQARPASNTWFSEDQAGPELAPLFTLEAGAVSEPIKAPMGYELFRIEETRVNPETSKREIRASALIVQPKLTEEEKTALDEKLNGLQEQAKADLAAAASQAGAAVQTTPEPVSSQATEIPGVAPVDTSTFLAGIANLQQGEVSPVIRGRDTAYIARITEVIPAVPQPLEAVRDRVVADTIAELKQQPEYIQKVQQLAAEISQKAKTIDEAKAAYTDVLGEVKQVGPFTPQTYDFRQGPFWNAQEIVPQILEAGEGKIVGPINDFMGTQYLVQLVEKIAPTEEAWKQEYPKAKEELRKSLLARRESERLEDYVNYLMLNANVPITKNEAAILRTLGLDEESQKARAEEEAKNAAEAAEEAPADAAAPAEAAPVAAPAETPAPAPADAAAPAETPAQ